MSLTNDQIIEAIGEKSVLGAGIDQRALGPGKGQGVAVGFQQVLADIKNYI